MLPSIDVRLQTVMKALTEVVIPALPTDEGLARDQARLVVGHLQMISLQWKHAAKFEAGSLIQLCGLARGLMSECAAELAPADHDILTVLVAGAEAVDHSDVDATRDAAVALGKAVDAIVSGRGSARPVSAAMTEVVLRYAKTQAWRERAWSAAQQLDPDAAELPPIEAIIG